MRLSSDTVQKILRRVTALAAVCAAAGTPAATVAAQSPSDPEQARPSRRYYSQPIAEEPAIEAEAVALAYRDALSQLVAAEPAAAVAAVTALEHPAGPAVAQSLHATRQGLATVLHGIALHDYRALEPAILLHVEMFRRHRDARNVRLEDHHLALIRFMVAEYAERGGTPEARATAAEVLAAVGLALLEDKRRTAANGTLERALGFNRTNGDALFGLAIDREWAGDYPNAVGLLERLVAVRPESAEGRLRLAINVQRVGRRRDAGELLTALTADPEAGWAAEIAYQELARNRIAEGDPAGAAALLREAIERFPASEPLRLQLAYVFDRAGDPVAARGAVAELAKSPPDGADESPRRRYARLPGSAAALDLEALRQSAGERLGALAEALESLAAGESG